MFRYGVLPAMSRAYFSVIALTLCPSVAFAQSCANYPYSNGINIEEKGGAVRVLSTVTAPIQGSDEAAAKTAKTKAEAEATAALKKFLSTDIKDSGAVLRALESTPSMFGDHYQERVNAADAVNRIAPQAKTLTSDVALFRLCTIKGAEYRVTVMVRPEAMRKLVGGGPGGSAEQPAAQQQTAPSAPNADSNKVEAAKAPAK